MRSALSFLVAARSLIPIMISAIMKALIETAKNMVTTNPDVVRVSSFNMQMSSPDAAVVQRTPAAQVEPPATDVVTHPRVTPVDVPVPYEHTLVE